MIHWLLGVINSGLLRGNIGLGLKFEDNFRPGLRCFNMAMHNTTLKKPYHWGYSEWLNIWVNYDVYAETQNGSVCKHPTLQTLQLGELGAQMVDGWMA